jgi:uncharacterized membrane protein YcgQ (UPF0703/DUF1980 family)
MKIPLFIMCLVPNIAMAEFKLDSSIYNQGGYNYQQQQMINAQQESNRIAQEQLDHQMRMEEYQNQQRYRIPIQENNYVPPATVEYDYPNSVNSYQGQRGGGRSSYGY